MPFSRRIGALSQPVSRQRGFTYLLVLFFVALMGAVLAATGTVWHTVAKREKEAELLFVGEQFRRAIGMYYERSPGTAKQFPLRLEDLLKDDRFPTTQRYLRKIFVDPVTGTPEWGLVKLGDRIVGVHSLSADMPLKSSGFQKNAADFGTAARYQDWVFAYSPGQSLLGAATGTAAGTSIASPATTASSQQNQPSVAGSDTATDPRSQGNECADMRRTDMLLCLEMEGPGRTACERESSKRYAACLRDRPR